MQNRTSPNFLVASVTQQMIGLAIAGGLQLLVPRERRVVVGCALLALGFIVFASQSRS